MLPTVETEEVKATGAETRTCRFHVQFRLEVPHVYEVGEAEVEATVLLLWMIMVQQWEKPEEAVEVKKPLMSAEEY
jgi:hypothetical protein